jgi:hypothetical protein
VLEKTIAGLQLARILMVHEPKSGSALTTVARLRDYFRKAGITAKDEGDAIVRMLGLTEPLDEPLRADVAAWFRRFFENLMDPGGTFRFPSDLCPLGGPMMSLRDVEEQAPIMGYVEQ